MLVTDDYPGKVKFGISDERYIDRYELVCDEVQELLDFYTRSRNPGNILPPPDEAAEEIKKIFRDADSFEVLDIFVKKLLTLHEEEMENLKYSTRPEFKEPSRGARGCRLCGTELQKKTRQWPKYCPWCAKMRKYASDRQAIERRHRWHRAKAIQQEYKDEFDVKFRGWPEDHWDGFTMEQALAIEEYRRESIMREDVLSSDKVAVITYTEDEGGMEDDRIFVKNLTS